MGKSYNGMRPQYTGAIDQEGRDCDMSMTMEQRRSILGDVWMIGTGYISLAANTNKGFLTFKTPADKTTIYEFPETNKSGNELLITLNEGGEVANGTAITPRRLNRQFAADPDANCPFTATKAGASTDAQAMSVSGGVIFPYRLAPGAANPATALGGSENVGGCMKLKKDTVYTVIYEAKGGAVTFASTLMICAITE